PSALQILEADRDELAQGARRFENWEFSYALVLGLGEAARYALEVGVEETGRRDAALRQLARHSALWPFCPPRHGGEGGRLGPARLPPLLQHGGGGRGTRRGARRDPRPAG